jgi:hypothetical protein
MAFVRSSSLVARPQTLSRGRCLAQRGGRRSNRDVLTRRFDTCEVLTGYQFGVGRSCAPYLLCIHAQAGASAIADKNERTKQAHKSRFRRQAKPKDRGTPAVPGLPAAGPTGLSRLSSPASSGMTLFGLGSAFWGIATGLVACRMLHGPARGGTSRE